MAALSHPTASERLLLFADEIALLNKSVAERFQGLSEREINWKPHKDKWSIAQCFDHLLHTDRAYFPAFDAILEGHYSPNLWQRLPVIPHAIGKSLVKNIGREPTQKLKTISLFEPSQSSIDNSIFAEFLQHQEVLRQYLQRLSAFDTPRIIISIPISTAFVLPVFDALTFLVNHQFRHVWQAEQVKAAVNFGII